MKLKFVMLNSQTRKNMYFLILLIYICRIFKLINNERKQISDCLVMCVGKNERKDYKRALLDVIVMFIKTVSSGDSFKPYMYQN